MKSGQALTTNDASRQHLVHAAEDRPTPGFSDEVGERFVIVGNDGEAGVELLRFRQTLTTIPGFEVALRRRTERLSHFHHPSFVAAPTVEYLGRERSLSLRSIQTQGRRLSDLVPHVHTAPLAASVLHQIAPALKALREYDDNAGHGALTASRIIIAPHGPVIVEHVLGPALERLHLTAKGMRVDLGIPVLATTAGQARTDWPADYYQLALIALSMLLGRALTPDDYADLPNALDAAFPSTDPDAVKPVPGLRAWLERALQFDNRAFDSSEQAVAALRFLNVQEAVDTPDRWRALLDTVKVERPEPPGIVTPAEDVSVEERAESQVAALLEVVSEDAQVSAGSVPIEKPEVAVRAGDPGVRIPVAASKHQVPGILKSLFDYRRAVAALAILALIEAVVIAVLLVGRRPTSPPPPPSVAEIALLTAQPGAVVTVDGREAGVTPLQLTIGADTRSISVKGPQPAAPKQDAIVGSTGQQNNLLASATEPIASASRARTAVTPPPPPVRTGGLRVESPIALEIFEGQTRLGSTTTGIVSAPAGRHQLELVNSAVGYRSRQVVDIKAGQTASIRVSLPNGRLDVNAVPWAEVLIDGKSVGETPIGNHSISLGEHEIVFRHPQLGEVRRTVVVRSDGVTRVSANLER
jgi:hypothetical protein